MTIGNVTQDDLYQGVAILFCIISTIFWLYVMVHSSSPLFFLPPLIASTGTLVFYMLVIFVSMSTLDATILSAATRLMSMIMWTISGGAMIYIVRRNGNKI